MKNTKEIMIPIDVGTEAQSISFQVISMKLFSEVTSEFMEQLAVFDKSLKSIQELSSSKAITVKEYSRLSLRLAKAIGSYVSECLGGKLLRTETKSN